MATLDTNLNQSPYFDDYNANNNYYRVLFKPSVAVQARELTQLQTIMQDQINKFGRNVFKEGSVVEGCAFTFDNAYNYVKINDQYTNSYAISSVSSFNGMTVVNQNGLKALIVNTVPGFQSQDPNLNTLYIKYINSVTSPVVQSQYSNADILQIINSSNTNIGNVTVASTNNSVGTGYAFTTTAGVIFKKGFFINVAPQTLIVSKYNNVPDGVSVGFAALETIINSNIDTSLLDNAAGSPNYAAPGADRFQLTPTLVTRNTADISNTSTFFSVCDFKGGLPISIKNDIQLSALGAEEARRTYETSGNFVVNPFSLSTSQKYDNNGNANTTYLNLNTSPGLAYVYGNRVQFLNNNSEDLRKGIDLETVQGQGIAANFGYYFNVQEYAGNFDNQHIAPIEIHSVAYQAVTNGSFLSTSYTAANKIGTAYCRGWIYNSGVPGVNNANYKAYIFNVQMLPGYAPQKARSLVIKNGSTVSAIADIILQYDAGSNSNIAVIQDTIDQVMVHPFGQKALSANGFSNTSYIYRYSTNSQHFDTTGHLGFSIPAGDGATETPAVLGTPLPTSAALDYIIVPIANGQTANLVGTVNTYTNGAVIGSSTQFTDSANGFVVGDFIYNSTDVRQVTSVVNNTFMTVANGFSTNSSALNYSKFYPAGVPLNFAPTWRTISANSTTVNATLNQTLTTNMNVIMYFDVLRSQSSTIPTKKKITRGTLVRINTSSHPNGTTGPWCLGIPDVLNLNHVWVDSTGANTFSNTNPDLVSQFTLDSGMREALYDCGYLKTSSPIANNAALLVSIDHFQIDTSYSGHGFFLANSYPIDDANTANTSAIRTYQIPLYTTSAGTTLDLRDTVDFRPYANATANITSVATSNAAAATLNPSTTSTMYVDTRGSYLPSPDDIFSTTIQHYLPRVDNVSLSSGGQVVITQGVPSNLPVAPSTPPGAMAIGYVTVAPYPTLSPDLAKLYNRYDYATQVSIQQTKRYTMADIGKLDNRLQNVEYYTALSLLEKSAQSQLVRSSVTGQNRFQNGILVDPFRDHTIGNTLDPQYRIAIDSSRSEARPFFTTINPRLYYDQNSSTGTVAVGDIVTLQYNEVTALQQNYASKYRNCIEGNIYNYYGTIALYPRGSVDSDMTVGPNVIGNVSAVPNYVNMQQYLPSAIGSDWGAWANVAVSNTATTASNPDGSISASYQTQTTSSTTSQLSSSTQSLQQQQAVVASPIQPYIKPVFVLFIARGLKPNSTIYAYFNNVPVTNRTMQIYPYSGTTTVVSGQLFTTEASPRPIVQDSSGNNYAYTLSAWSAPLQADVNGNIYGVFNIPAATFPVGDLQFQLADVSSLVTGSAAITTQASTLFYGFPLSALSSSGSISSAQQQNSVQQGTSSVGTGNGGGPTLPTPTIAPIISNVATTIDISTSEGQGGTAAVGGTGGDFGASACGAGGGSDGSGSSGGDAGGSCGF